MLLDLAADAIEEAGAVARTDADRVPRGLRDAVTSPECAAHTKEQHYKSEFAIRAAAMIRAGVDPGLLDELAWWRIDDLWVWAVDALRHLRPRGGRPHRGWRLARSASAYARRRGVDLGTPN